MIYIAFLHGINVGKHNRIKMNDLKYIFLSMGFKNVQTYLQNGNVLFESDKDEEIIRRMIEREIMIRYRYVVPVVLRTSKELKEVILKCPFSKEEIQKAKLLTGERVYISFLKKIAANNKVELLDEINTEGDKFKIVGRDVYLLFLHKNYRNSKLSRNIQKLDIYATTRNWNTILKLNKLISRSI